MLETFTDQSFAPHLGAGFELAEPAGVTLTLVELTILGPATRPPGGGREAFSLIFEGPRHPVLPQRTYPIAASPLGAFELFLVPVETTAELTRYEAIFT